jgi:2-hydroxy-3-keto-5-methylthiopentenyl-1-phosphate phosphatase
MKSRIAIFCDFDGTISRRDIGDLFFRDFGSVPVEDAFAERLAGAISGREALVEGCRNVRFDRARFLEWLRRFEIDPYFQDFIDFSQDREFELVVVSDGLDLYIREFLARNGIARLPLYANGARVEGTALVPSFPFFNRLDCTECGNCKTSHLRRKQVEGYFTVYVGDGRSDRCPCESAHMVFAKGCLRDYCISRGIQHFQYRNFRDVEMILTETVCRRLSARGGPPAGPGAPV